jgi:arsenite methyltransferase
MDDVATKKTHQEVQRYYGETLSSTDDLKTTACCTTAAMPTYVKNYLADVHDEVLQRYYGCGLVLPESLEGMSILDLGCGAGRDVYLLARLVGETGRVVGVDMTPAQLAVANEYRDYHASLYGYAQSNVDFVEANIEQLDAAGLEEASFDLIVSNCVINLAVDKAAVLASAKKLLRPGGEMYFADVYADRRIPDELKSDPVLYGECLAGAMYPPDFVRTAQEAGFLAPQLVEESAIDITDPDVQQRIGDLQFCSVTYRLFNIDGLESSEENYGQKAIYLGDIPEHPDRLALSQQIEFPIGREVAVSGNISCILEGSRFSASFQQIGDKSRHLGTFSSTSDNLPRFDTAAETTGSSCC